MHNNEIAVFICFSEFRCRTHGHFLLVQHMHVGFTVDSFDAAQPSNIFEFVYIRRIDQIGRFTRLFSKCADNLRSQNRRMFHQPSRRAVFQNFVVDREDAARSGNQATGISGKCIHLRNIDLVLFQFGQDCFHAVRFLFGYARKAFQSFRIVLNIGLEQTFFAVKHGQLGGCGAGAQGKYLMSHVYSFFLKCLRSD